MTEEQADELLAIAQNLKMLNDRLTQLIIDLFVVTAAPDDDDAEDEKWTLTPSWT